jgi:hypothetical protein
VRELQVATFYSFWTTLLPNGARLLCSGIGPYEQGRVDLVLKHVDVALLNFGLHYTNPGSVETMLRSALFSLSAWRIGSPHTRIALWREGSAQHFASTGSYTKGAEVSQADVKPGAPCECSPFRGGDQSTNLNVRTWQLERTLAPVHGVGLVPFFNLTAPRHNMHRGHYCAFDRAKKTPGRCCDCTHLCYTPLFWEAVFGGMHRALRRALGAGARTSAGHAITQDGPTSRRAKRSGAAATATDAAPAVTKKDRQSRHDIKLLRLALA